MGRCTCLLTVGCLLFASRLVAADADLILHNGKVITVDKAFSVHQALAVQGGKLLKVGSDADVLKTRGPATQVVDLQGKTVMPGLIDSHVHPGGAAMHEFDHPISDMESIDDVLAYIRGRAKVLSKGEWIHLQQVFITRLKEQRYPTKEELDAAAPDNPVFFETGPDGALNSLALKLNKIDQDFKVTDGGPGYVEKDEKTGMPTGILRSCTRYVKSPPTGRKPDESDHLERLLLLLKDYNAVGLTAVCDRNAGKENIRRYQALQGKDLLPVRVALSHSLGTNGSVEAIQKEIRAIAEHPLTKPDPKLHIIGVKAFLDGGMLTGSAYMREPWGVSSMYAITDPKYRGLLYIPREKLLPIVQATAESGLQFTAHSVGDGAVTTLMDVYEELSKKLPLAKTRPCITHSNFMTKDVVEKMPKLGVVADIQPIWLNLDTRTLVKQFGYDRLRYFQPLQSIFAAGGIVGGGSDHMQKIGSLRAVNPYNPWLGMWTSITRKARGYDGQLHPEEALTRAQAVRFYTINNAHLLFLEDQIGSLEEGKRADLIVIDRDILTCPVDDIKDTQVLQTYLDGKKLYEKK